MKYFVVIVLFLVLVSGCIAEQPTDTKLIDNNSIKEGSTIAKPFGEINIVEKDSQTVSDSDKSSSVKTKPEELNIPPGSIAIFYRSSLSDARENLKGFQKTSSSESIFEKGFTVNVDTSSSSKAVMRYIPSINWFDVADSTTSYSYSESSIAPLTLDGRLFTVTSRSTVTSIDELDPKTGKVLSSMRLQSRDTSEPIAIVGNDIYYRTKEKENLYGKHSSGGELMKNSFGSGVPIKLLEYGDPDNNGHLYSASNSLVSPVYDFDTKTYTIRQHDLITGKVTEIYNNVPSGGFVTFFSGDDALYQRIIDGNMHTINRYPLEGQAETVLTLQLETGDRGLSVDQSREKLLITTYGNDFRVRQVQVYNIETNNLEELEIEPFGSGAGYEYEFVILD